MVDKMNQQEVEAKRTAYLNGLYSQAISGDIDAGEELSKIAMGGFPLARDLIRQMDERFSRPVVQNVGTVPKEVL